MCSCLSNLWLSDLHAASILVVLTFPLVANFQALEVNSEGVGESYGF